MGYKKMNWNMTFAEIDLMTSMEHNRSLKMNEPESKYGKFKALDFDIPQKRYSSTSSPPRPDPQRNRGKK
jgi:hypothetical protein